MGIRQVEVTASATVNVPSRFAEPDDAESRWPTALAAESPQERVTADIARRTAFRRRTNTIIERKFRDDLKCQLNSLQSMVEDLCRQQQVAQQRTPRIAVSCCSPI